MHLNAICVYTRCISSFHRTFRTGYARPLYSASTGYKVDDDGRAIESLSSWEIHHAQEVGRRPVDTHGVVIDDLPGTLELQRARNRATVIRTIETPSKTSNPIYRPLIHDQDSVGKEPSQVSTTNSTPDENSGKSHRNDGRLKHKKKRVADRIRNRSAASVQTEGTFSMGRTRRTRIGHREGHAKSSEVLEYEGVPSDPVSSWGLKENSTPLLQRPWLSYMQENSGNNANRSVSNQTILAIR